ncbi:YckD family protein [Caldibacillus lycopersici]|uniref:YckD family protein n=1 Tax=Perspicuibacillus lycopersici TaxID=1325689 RepID=A0AAE3LPL7_9BACI|nr:YckD family protein [Perspicuibacillus lycopersici]MCU9615101.1 YckD family protein [Perspicuibacillus lycopersici]
MFSSLKLSAILLAAALPIANVLPDESKLLNESAASTAELEEDWNYVQVEQRLGENEEVQSKEANSSTEEVKLSEAQIKELEGLTADLMEGRKQLINKYVEFGILTQEKADKILEHMDKHFQKLKEENFVPKWDKHKMHKHKGKCDCEKNTDNVNQ